MREREIDEVERERESEGGETERKIDRECERDC